MGRKGYMDSASIRSQFHNIRKELVDDLEIIGIIYSICKGWNSS